MFSPAIDSLGGNATSFFAGRMSAEQWMRAVHYVNAESLDSLLGLPAKPTSPEDAQARFAKMLEAAAQACVKVSSSLRTEGVLVTMYAVAEEPSAVDRAEDVGLQDHEQAKFAPRFALHIRFDAPSEAP